MELEDLPFLAFTGQTLNLEERAGLETQMAKRRLEGGYPQVYFWGKISGTEADYLVVYGFSPSESWPKKTFYFCTTKNYDLQAFPDLPEDFREKCKALNSRLKGDPTALLSEEDEEEDAGDEEEESKEKPPKFSEIHRLVYIVENIDSETSVVPKEAYIVTPTHEIRRNLTFTGLTAAEAGNLANYYHFREPFALSRKSVLEKRRLVASTEFLDPLSEDTPKGVWSLRVDKAQNQASGRSFVWPGYFFYHKLGSGKFGGAYFGDGRRNADIGFMV